MKLLSISKRLMQINVDIKIRNERDLA